MEHSRKSRKLNKILQSGILTILMTLCFTACAGTPSSEKQNHSLEPSKERIDTGFVVTKPDSYDSADTCIFLSEDRDSQSLTFLNLDVNKKYTLTYDGTSRFYDKYGDGITIDQLLLGEIVDLTFQKSKKHLTTLQISPSAWAYDDVERYEIDRVRGEISIGSEIYKTTSVTQYVTRKHIIEEETITDMDLLSFRGIGKQILTVRVEKGHGYLRLKNDDDFIGGWIEVGQSQIRRITEDMLLPVPEGIYQVKVSNKGGGGTKTVQIERNEETIVDIGEFKIPEPSYGRVTFRIEPANAQVYIDGILTDITTPVNILYGLHQMIVRADNYQTITQYFNLSQTSATIDTSLEAIVTETEPETKAEEVEYKVYVEAPEGVEVYLDGNYVGLAPCSFRKEAGTHIIIIRRTGYETKSYTMQFDDAKKDISYSFPDLIKDDNQTQNASSQTD